MAEVDYSFDNLNLKSAKKVKTYTTGVITDAEEIIKDIIPQKILSLEKLDKEEFQKYSDLSSVTSEVNIPKSGYELYKTEQEDTDASSGKTKKRKIDETAERPPQIPCNKKLIRLVDLMKPEAKAMIETCESIRMWITLLIPKIEDGNNFGVGIQEEVLNEVQAVQTESILKLDAVAKYFVGRGELLAKIAKHPFIDDYHRAVKELDEREYLNIQFTISELRSHYVLLLDTISKNYDKIKKPRSANNMENMY